MPYSGRDFLKTYFFAEILVNIISGPGLHENHILYLGFAKTLKLLNCSGLIMSGWFPGGDIVSHGILVKCIKALIRG